MKTKTMIRISGIILLATVVSLAVLALIYILHYPQLIFGLATVSWNG